MLHAILNGKARRVSFHSDESQSWRAVFQHYEDLLTAAFWGRISYLSEESLQHFLSSLVGVEANEWGKFESIVFWPKYDFPDLIDESVSRWIDDEGKFAEPDVVMNFTHAALLIEVKPPTGGQQYQQQWCKEIYAWKNSENTKPTLHFLALGNLPENAPSLFAELQEIFDYVTFHGIEWPTLRAKLQHQTRKCAPQQEQRLIDDCLRALSLYGVREPLPPWQPFLHFLFLQTLPTNFSFLEGKQ